MIVSADTCEAKAASYSTEKLKLSWWFTVVSLFLLKRNFCFLTINFISKSSMSNPPPFLIEHLLCIKYYRRHFIYMWFYLIHTTIYLIHIFYEWNGVSKRLRKLEKAIQLLDSMSPSRYLTSGQSISSLSSSLNRTKYLKFIIIEKNLKVIYLLFNFR